VQGSGGPLCPSQRGPLCPVWLSWKKCGSRDIYFRVCCYTS